MDKNKVLKLLDEDRIIVAIRTDELNIALRTIQSCLEGGLKVFEISLLLKHAMELFKGIAGWRNQAAFGGGEIFDRAEAKRAQALGADFLVSPLCSDEVIEFARINEMTVIISGFTPTEIIRGWRLGADMVSVYPVAFAGGCEYIKTIKDAYPKVKLLANGGIDINNIISYLAAGAYGVLLDEVFKPDPRDLSEGKPPDFALIRRRASTFKGKIRDFLIGGEVAVQRGLV